MKGPMQTDNIKIRLLSNARGRIMQGEIALHYYAGGVHTETYAFHLRGTETGRYKPQAPAVFDEEEWRKYAESDQWPRPEVFNEEQWRKEIEPEEEWHERDCMCDKCIDRRIP